jgi:hemerythrin
MSSESNVPKWSDKYMIGIPDVDFQHQYFLRLIQRLEKRFESGMDSHITLRHFNEILKYADFHFQSEENLMLMYNYPGYQTHHNLHIDLLDEIGTTIYYFQLEKKNATEVIEMLVKWFLDHTVEEDIKFGDFMKDSNMVIKD